MVLALLLVATAFYFVWKGFVSLEAKQYGESFITNLKESLAQIDAAVNATFTPAYYTKLHGQKLSEINIEEEDHLKKLIERLKKITHLDQVYLALFTDCNPDHNASCYTDNDYSTASYAANVGYDPKSRPWYLATRSHTNWTVMKFMLRGSTRLSDYPATWGIAIVRHLLASPEEEQELRKIVADKETFKSYMKGEKGIWLSLGFVTSRPESQHSFLHMVMPDKVSRFTDVDAFLQTIRFPDSVLTGESPLNISCHAITKLLGLSYQATVPCHVNGERIQFFFTKRYDNPSHLVILGVFSLLVLFGFYRFFSYVTELEKTRLVATAGMKLVHDLRKGIVTQLNALSHDYGEDFTREATQPGFQERLQNRLQRHFTYLGLLNRYLNLLSSNFLRKCEKDWVVLTAKQLQDYLTWVMGPIEMQEGADLDAPTIFDFVYQPDGMFEIKSLLRARKSLPQFFVPEMSLYRILKNLWENYNTYGKGPFHMYFYQDNDCVRACFVNAISSLTQTQASSTHMGMIIIRQLLQDNFGNRAMVKTRVEDKTFMLELSFPILKTAPFFAGEES